MVLSNISNSSCPHNENAECGRYDLRKHLHHVVCLCSSCLNPYLFFLPITVYRRMRKRNRSEISQVTSLIKAKLEAKIAKTAAILTGALVFSFLPGVVMFSLGEVFPILHTSTSFLLWETLIQLNSLLNPLLYCCRDRRFRNAVLELLRLRKPAPVGHPTVGAMPVRRRNPLGACTVEDTPGPHDATKPTSLLARTESRGLAVASGRGPGICQEITSLRSLSAPTLDATLTTSSIFLCRNHHRLSL